MKNRLLYKYMQVPPKWYQWLQLILNYFQLLKLIILPIKIISKSIIKYIFKPLNSQYLGSQIETFESLNSKLCIEYPDNIPQSPNYESNKQLYRQGLYSFLTTRNKTYDPKITRTLSSHIVSTQIHNGYRYENSNVIYDNSPLTEENLSALLLALSVLHERPKEKIPENVEFMILESSIEDILKEKYDILINEIIDNNYSLRQMYKPNINLSIDNIWQILVEKSDGRPEAVNMKALYANWAPANQNAHSKLLWLAMLKVWEKLNRAKESKPLYNKFAYKYLYILQGLLASFSFSKKHQEISMISLSILDNLSQSKLEKFYIKTCMLILWLTGFKNGLLSGFVNKQVMNLKDKYKYLKQELHSPLRTEVINNLWEK